MCGGVLSETKCLPCLQGCSRDNTLRQDADDMCMICFTEALSCAPAIQVGICIGIYSENVLTYSFYHLRLPKFVCTHLISKVIKSRKIV